MTPEELRTMVAGHQPATPLERQCRRSMLAHLAILDHPLDEEADRVHVTASAIILDPARTRVVLHRHRRLDVWLQPGGHIDAGEDPRDAVRREALEETGLATTHDDADRLLHLDVHDGPRDHLHLDLRWLLFATAEEFAPGGGESQQLQWVSFTEVAAFNAEPGLQDAVMAAQRRTA